MYACDIFTAMMSHRETGSVFFISYTHTRGHLGYKGGKFTHIEG